ncbi:MAG: DNA-binding protein [Pseudomonas sp.]|nr:MAG: DNA-binding protein [Pseudomonas sp.]
MAVGVPENDVFAAADAVLARGERPTVERVRLELGRGSPARVGNLLDQWWETLAARLRGETRLPGLPAEVAQAFISLWQQATTLAQGVVELSLADQRQVVVNEREHLAASEAKVRLEQAQARRQTAEALAARDVAEIRLADLEQLLTQRQAQIDDLLRQRDAFHVERDSARRQADEMAQQNRVLHEKVEQQRAAQQDYLRGVEDRAHREVDRAREESRAAAMQLKQLGRQADILEKRLNSALTELGDAQRETAIHKERAEQNTCSVQQLQASLAAQLAALNGAQQQSASHAARAEALGEQVLQLQSLLKPNRKKGASTSSEDKRS